MSGMKNVIVAALLVFVTGCYSTVPETTPAPETLKRDCPVVACAWSDVGSCVGAYSHESTEYKTGSETCWVFTAACVSEPVDPACVPEECKQNQFATCTEKK